MKKWQSASVIAAVTMAAVFAPCSAFTLWAQPRLTEAQAAALQATPPSLVPGWGTFWSVSRPDYPPLPFDNHPDLPVYLLPDGSWLVDDSTVQFPPPPSPPGDVAAAARSFLTQPSLASQQGLASPMLNGAMLADDTDSTNSPPQDDDTDSTNSPPVLIDPGSIPAFGTFWLMVETNSPPLPCDPCTNCDVYALSDGSYLIDDTSYVWPQPSGDDGGGTQQTNQYLYVSGDFWLEITGVTNSLANLVLHGTTAGTPYTILSRQTLTPDDAWDPEAPLTGATGKDWTPIQIPTFGRPVLYFQALVGSATPERLWIYALGISNNCFNLILQGTTEDTSFDIMSTTTLLSSLSNWASETNFLGASGQFWTPVSIPLSGRSDPNLFLSARSWVSSSGSGIPDWWFLQYGLSTSTDPYAQCPSGDGWTILQAYQNGWNPLLTNTPPAPSNFTASLLVGGTQVALSWSALPGPVMGYVIQRLDPGQTSYTLLAQLGSGVVSYTDGGAFQYCPPYDYNNASCLGSSTYLIQGLYPSGSSAPATAQISSPASPYSVGAALVRGPSGRYQLAFAPLPGSVTNLQLIWLPWDYCLDWPGAETDQDISLSQLTNRLYSIPDVDALANVGYVLYVRGVGASGPLGAPILAGHLAGDAPCFVDGRRELKQNLAFRLRAATLTQNLSLAEAISVPGWGDFPSVAPSDTNSLESSFFHWRRAIKEYYGVIVDDTSFVARNDLWPYTVNYQLHNSLYDPSNSVPAEFVWQTNIVTEPAPPVLGLDDPYWISQDLGNLADVGVATGTNELSLQGGLHNLFGLAVAPGLCLSMDWAGNSYLAIVAPGEQISLPDSSDLVAYYSQFQEPGLLTTGYYFAPVLSPGTDLLGLQGAPAEEQPYPLPVNVGFEPPNQPPLIIASVGQPTVIGGWATQQITNVSPTKMAYLGQYFESAFKIDTNGTVTTSETGILSPYGDFFPTEPGPVAVVTVPDIDTGQRGTGVVNVIKLQTDVDHNGQMDLSFAGPDNTSQARPLLMWVNNGHTEPGTGGNPDKDLSTWGNPPANPPNYSYGAIRCQRNLENFARLWACGLPKLPPSQGYTVTLTMSPSSGNPAINLYAAFTNSAAYLTDTNAAAAQFTKMYLGNQLIFDYSKELAAINTSQSYNLPLSSDGTPQYTNFLFEGAGIGAGQLTLTISQTTAQGSNVIAQTSAWLDLHDVKDFFEQAYATNVTSGKPPSSLVSDFSVIQTAASPAPDEAKQIIVFIHGINNTVTDYETTTRTIFKRLYWAGYHGRFASFRWPCSYLWPTAKDPFLFNLGEFYAFKSATALKNYLSYLRNNRPDLAGYAIDLYAHSQGNVVTSEAILQGAPFDNYILSQGAFPAHCYDTNAPFLQQLLDAETNSVNAVQTPFYPVDGGYHGYCSSIHGNLIDFYNTNDFALATGTTLGLQTNWKEDQRTQKPEAFIGGPSYIYDPSTHVTTGYYTFGNSYTVTDLQEIKALVARSRSAAVGAQGGLHGAISGSVDLFSSYGFGNTRDEHSAQFARPIQTCLPYYRQMLTSFQIVTP